MFATGLEATNIVAKRQAPPGPRVEGHITFAGQTPGAMLIVKDKPCGSSSAECCEADVGDYIKSLNEVPANVNIMEVESFRSRAIGYVMWDSFRPVL